MKKLFRKIIKKWLLLIVDVKSEIENEKVWKEYCNRMKLEEYGEELLRSEFVQEYFKKL